MVGRGFPRAFLVCALLVLPRLGLAPALPIDFDAVDFTLALEDYDLAALRPHFPGYPLYVLAGRLLAALGCARPYALLGLLASALLGACLVAAAGDRATGWGAALVWLALPGVWLESLVAHADLPALALFGCAWLALSRGRTGAAGLLVGLALGFRPSALPLAAVLAARPGRARAAVGLGLGLALWLPAFLGQVGPARFLELGAAFSAGHFSDWGQTALSGALAPRAGRFLGGLGSAAGLVPAASALLCGLLLCLRRGPRPGPGWWAWTLPYTAWLLVGQNLGRGRHYLPLLFAGCWLLGRLPLQPRLGERSRRPLLRAGLLALILVLAAGGVARARSQSLPSPAAETVALAEAVERRLGPVLLAGDSSVRLADLCAPLLLRRRLRSFAALADYRAGLWDAPEWIVAAELAGAPPPGASPLGRVGGQRGWGSTGWQVYLWRRTEP